MDPRAIRLPKRPKEAAYFLSDDLRHHEVNNQKKEKNVQYRFASSNLMLRLYKPHCVPPHGGIHKCCRICKLCAASFHEIPVWWTISCIGVPSWCLLGASERCARSHKRHPCGNDLVRTTCTGPLPLLSARGAPGLSGERPKLVLVRP
jgi:hypothetical protein